MPRASLGDTEKVQFAHLGLGYRVGTTLWDLCLLKFISRNSYDNVTYEVLRA